MAKPRTHYDANDDHKNDWMDDVVEPGMVDSNGNKYHLHDEYEAEEQRKYIGRDKPKVEYHNDSNEICGQELPF